MRPLAVLGLFVTVALAACGGDDGGVTPSPTASAVSTVTVSPAP